MAINLSTLSAPTVAEQLNRENSKLTWKDYAVYLHNHKDMSFSQGQCLYIAGNIIKNLSIEDIASQTNANVEYIQKESDKINFDEQIHTKEAELEVYKTIIPSEPMRLIGKLEESVGSNKICIFISVNENPYISVWRQYVEEQETDEDIYSFTNYKRVNEFKTYNNYETFMKKCPWSPKNINYQDENNVLKGSLYKDYINLN